MPATLPDTTDESSTGALDNADTRESRREREITIEGAGAGRPASRRNRGSTILKPAAQAKLRLKQKLAARSQQMEAILQDEKAGLARLRALFLPQLEHEAFGEAVDKLRYIQLVFKQCGNDLEVASRWLVSRGTSMLTPQQALDLAQLELKYPSASFDELGCLLTVLGTPDRCTEFLRGELELSPYEEMELEIARTRATERASLRIRDPRTRLRWKCSLSRGSSFADDAARDGPPNVAKSQSINVFKRMLDRKISCKDVFPPATNEAATMAAD